MNKRTVLKMKMPEKQFSIRVKKELSVKNIPYFHGAIIILSVNVLVMALLIIFLNKLPPQVPLYYGLPRGEIQLSSPVSLIYPLLLSSFFLVINSILAIFSKSPFLKRVFVIGGIFIAILALITVIRIITITVNL